MRTKRRLDNLSRRVSDLEVKSRYYYFVEGELSRFELDLKEVIETILDYLDLKITHVPPPTKRIKLVKKGKKSGK